MQVDVIFDKEALYVDKHKQIETNQEFIQLYWGGRFGAKSESIARHLVRQSLRLPYFRCVLGRKVKDTVKDSQWKTIKDYVEKTPGLAKLFHFTVSPLEIKCVNGNEFLCRGFDKPEKIKSIKDPTYYWVEEMSEIDEEDFETAITTLRHRTENTFFFGSFNPEIKGEIYEDHWIFKQFFKEHHPKKDFVTDIKIEIDGEQKNLQARSIHTTYKDNPYNGERQRQIVQKYKADFERTQSQTSSYFYKVWTLGEWGNLVPENQFWYNFSELRHVKPLSYNPQFPIHITFDKNVNPYITCLAFQEYNQTFHQVKEFCLSHPDNRTRELSKHIIDWLKLIGYKSKLYGYGDATATHEDTNQQAGQNFYTIIDDILRRNGFLTEWRVPRYRSNQFLNTTRKRINPNGFDACDFVNEFYNNNLNFSMLVDENCRVSINDYISSKQDKNGNIDKSEKDPVTKGEKFGHCSQAKYYFICEYLYTEFHAYCQHRTKYL